MLDKTEIRAAMKSRRKALTPAERAAASEIICAKLAADSDVGLMVDPLEWGSPIAVYLASSQEIDLSPFIRKMLAMGVKVVAPRWNGETYELSVLKGLDDAHLRKGPMGILEPAEAEIVSPKSVEVWLVPGLAFTRNGKRLGYGGGWYDRLLADAPKKALKIGAAYSFQVVDDLPSEPHDVQLTGVVDDSLEHELVEFTTREEGFSAHVSIPKLGRRRVSFAVGVLSFLAAVVFYTWGCCSICHNEHWAVLTMLTATVWFLIFVVIVMRVLGGPVEARIAVSGENGICRRRFLSFLPLPPKRFPWSCWARAEGTYGFYSATASSSLSVFESGVEYRLFKTVSEAATRLSIQMNRAKRPLEGDAYRAVRAKRLGKLPFGMWIRKTKDGLGDEALIWPHALTDALRLLAILFVCCLFLSLILLEVMKIPVIGEWVALILGGLMWGGFALTLLGAVIFVLCGTYRLAILVDRVEYAWGIGPLMRRHTLLRSALAIDTDTDEVCVVDANGIRSSLFTMLAARYKLPLRLFVESALGMDGQMKAECGFGLDDSKSSDALLLRCSDAEVGQDRASGFDRPSTSRARSDLVK